MCFGQTFWKYIAAAFSFTFPVDGFAVPVPPQNQEDPRSETIWNLNITDTCSNDFNVHSVSSDIDIIIVWHLDIEVILLPL